MSNSPRISSCLLVGLALYWFLANRFWAPSASQGGERGIRDGKRRFPSPKAEGGEETPLRGARVGLMVTHTGTLRLLVGLLHWGASTARDAPKKHLGAWRLVLRAGKLFPLLGKPSSNSMAFPSSIPTLPGGSWPKSHREESRQSWTIDHPKAYSTPRTPNPSCPPLPSNRSMGLVLFVQGKGQAGAQQQLWQQQRGVASKSQPDHAMIQRGLSSHASIRASPQFIQGKTTEEEEGVEQINILLDTAGPLFGPDLFITLTAGLGTGSCCAQI